MLEFFKKLELKMKKPISLIIAVSISVVLGGCASQNPTRPKTAFLLQEEPTNSNQLIDSHRLRKGGHLLIIPFKPGVNVPATDELERIALSCVRGISDVLQENTVLEILDSTNSHLADLIIKGYIVNLKESRGVKKWFGAQKLSLGIQGQMIDQKTGSPIFTFSRYEIVNGKNADYKTMAYRMGYEIGEFIRDQLN